MPVETLTKSEIDYRQAPQTFGKMQDKSNDGVAVEVVISMCQRMALRSGEPVQQVAARLFEEVQKEL